MLTVDTIGRIRREYFVGTKPIREISRSLKVSRKTIRKAIRASQTELAYANISLISGAVSRLASSRTWAMTPSGAAHGVASEGVMAGVMAGGSVWVSSCP